jgi:hypothetical protein
MITTFIVPHPQPPQSIEYGGNPGPLIVTLLYLGGDDVLTNRGLIAHLAIREKGPMTL